MLAVRCSLTTADLLLCKKCRDKEGKLRNALCIVGCSTLQHTTQHTLSILWRREDKNLGSIAAYAGPALTTEVRPATG